MGKDLFICRLRSKNDGFAQEFQGRSTPLQDVERMHAKENYIVVFHRRLT